MNKFFELISHGLHQIQRTFFPDLEHEAGPIPESLVQLTYILETVHSKKNPIAWTMLDWAAAKISSRNF